MQVGRKTVVRALLSHDECDLIERISSATDEEMVEIGARAGVYLLQPADPAAPDRGGMGTTRAISVAAIEVLEGAARQPRRNCMERKGRQAEAEAIRRAGLDD